MRPNQSVALIFLCRSVPSITAYHGAFQTQNEICIVMEYCTRGDLLERLLSEGRAFSEPRVAEVAATLLTTLQVRRIRKMQNRYASCGHAREMHQHQLLTYAYSLTWLIWRQSDAPPRPQTITLLLPPERKKT